MSQPHDPYGPPPPHGPGPGPGPRPGPGPGQGPGQGQLPPQGPPPGPPPAAAPVHPAQAAHPQPYQQAPGQPRQPAPWDQHPPLPRKRGIAALFTGAGYFFRGLGWVARRPGKWLFGLIPALIVLIAYVAALTALGWNLGDLAGWVTPFADDWSESVRSTVRVIAGIALFGAALFLAIITFTAITLTVGEPFYEHIAVKVEESRGGAPPDPDDPLLTQIGRAIRDAALLGAVAIVFAIVFFVCGFIPIVGQTVVPVVAACVSGYFLAGELTSIALERRGIRRKQRFAILKQNRMLAVGFGAATFVVFLIPFGAVLAMPGAVAGGTLLARERLAINPLVTGGEHGTPGHH